MLLGCEMYGRRFPVSPGSVIYRVVEWCGVHGMVKTSLGHPSNPTTDCYIWSICETVRPLLGHCGNKVCNTYNFRKCFWCWKCTSYAFLGGQVMSWLSRMFHESLDLMPWHLYSRTYFENGGNLIQQGLWYGWHDDFILIWWRTSVDVMRRRSGEQGENAVHVSTMMIHPTNTEAVTKQFHWQRSADSSVCPTRLVSSYVWCAYFWSFTLALHMERYLNNLLIFCSMDDRITATRMRPDPFI